MTTTLIRVSISKRQIQFLNLFTGGDYYVRKCPSSRLIKMDDSNIIYYNNEFTSLMKDESTVIILH